MSFRGEPFALQSPDEAIGALRAAAAGIAGRGAAHPCPLFEARGRVLARSIVADRDSPPFDSSAMDGYAVRAADLAGVVGPDVRIEVLAESRIGAAPPPLPVAGAVRISTGAPLPPGGDAVIKREDVRELPGVGGVAAIVVSGERARAVRAGENIRRRGENAPKGGELVRAGTIITPPVVGALAAVGDGAPWVAARVRVAVIVTGDELAALDSEPGPFQIRDSNGPMLAALLGWRERVQVVSVARCRDDAAQLGEALGQAAGEADVVVLSGGVSMGHRDPVRAAAEGAGARIVFHGLPQRPGKPMLGAVVESRRGPIILFGLPGNPVSAMITCVRIVLPVLDLAAGAAPGAALRVRLCNPDGKSLGLWWHRLVRLTDAGEAELIEGRGSGDLVAAGRSDGFIEVAPGRSAADHSELYPLFVWPR